MTITGFVNYLVNMAAYFIVNYIMVAAFDSKKNRTTFQDALYVFLLTFPLSNLKFFLNTSDFKYAYLFGILIICILYLHFCMEGNIWQKLLFVALQEMNFFLGELLVMVLFNEQVSKLTIWDYNEPIILLVDVVICSIGLIFYWIVLLVWKRYVMKKACDTKSFIVFLFFPLAQMFILMACNKMFFDIRAVESTSLYIGIVVGIFADILLMATILRQQQMKEIEEKLGEMKQTWEVLKKAL